MEAAFTAAYGVPPQFRVRCPGRVNLIGEHIDYNGYGVLPMAIDAATVLLVAPSNDDVIEIRNGEGEKYDPFRMVLPSSWNGAAPPKWYDYVLCGWRGIIDYLKVEQRGMKIMMSGTIPPSSGLSSSSSLVCAAALATLGMHTNEGFTEERTREWLAELCAEAEKMIGTQGGGMDQASEVLSQAGSALRIDFNPLSSRLISLPSQALFIVLHSGDTMNKAASNHFNQRVVECRIAAQILGKHLEVPSWNTVRRLKDVQDKAGKSLEEMLELVATIVPEKPTRQEVVAIIGEDNLDALLSENTKEMTSFIVRARARHCYSEARRVGLFEEACKKGDLKEMGKLMNESHDSTQFDYECSSDGLDVLVAECRKAGVYGVRLTGAGWGGCAVALVDKEDTVDLSHLNVLFVSSPSAGISLEKYGS